MNRRSFLATLVGALGMRGSQPPVPVAEPPGISLRFVRRFDGEQFVNRIDVLHGIMPAGPLLLHDMDIPMSLSNNDYLDDEEILDDDEIEEDAA